jgi:quercetin dioxygenase-like cupin family protein
MQDREWGPGDIIVLEPGEATSFEALTDAVNVVVKTPSAKGDKYDGAA